MCALSGALPRENPMKFNAKKKMDNAKNARILLPSASSVGPNILHWSWLGMANNRVQKDIFRILNAGIWYTGLE